MPNTETNPKDTSQPAVRGEDDRRGTVNPASNPAPHSPEADRDDVRKGEEKLESIAPD